MKEEKNSPLMEYDQNNIYFKDYYDLVPIEERRIKETPKKYKKEEFIVGPYKKNCKKEPSKKNICNNIFRMSGGMRILEKYKKGILNMKKFQEEVKVILKCSDIILIKMLNEGYHLEKDVLVNFCYIYTQLIKLLSKRLLYEHAIWQVIMIRNETEKKVDEKKFVEDLIFKHLKNKSLLLGKLTEKKTKKRKRKEKKKEKKKKRKKEKKNNWRVK